MPKEVNPKDPTKWSRTYESEECISIWKYDSNIHQFNPISVEHKWKKGFEGPDTKKKTLGDLVNETKPKKKSQRPKS
jgi:hypothetical protein